MFELDIDFNNATNKQRELAIEFSQGRMRAMQLDRASGNTYKLRTLVDEQLPDKLFSGDFLENPEGIGRLLQEKLQEAKPSKPNTQFAICSIPQRNIFLISQEIPRVSLEEAESVILNKVGDLLPMSVSEVYWDWRALGYTETKMQVQLAAVSQELVDGYIKCLKSAGLIPLMFEPGAESAARVGSQKGNAESLVWVELTKEYAIVSIARGSDVIFSTDIPLEVSPSGEANTSQLLARIKELVDYTQRQYRGQIKVGSQIRLYGDNQMVTTVLSTIQGSQPESINFQLSRIHLQQAQQNGFAEFIDELDEYVPLLGAAIRGLPNWDEGIESLNLVPELAKKEYVRKEIKRIAIQYLFLFVLNLGLIIIAITMLASRAGAELSGLDTQLAELQGRTEGAEYQQARNMVAEINSEVGTIANVYGQLYEWDRVFLELSEIVPEDIIITEIFMRPNTDDPEQKNYDLVINGGFRDRDSVLVFSNALKESIYFKDITVPLSSFTDAQAGVYQISGLLNNQALLVIQDPQELIDEAQQQEAEQGSNQADPPATDIQN